jgi:cytochrome c-type biogenesis protein CcmE
MRAKNAKFIVAFAVIGGGIAFLAAGKLKDAFRYSESVAAVAKGGEALIGRPLRIQGKLVNDSLVKKRDEGKPFFEFRVEDGPARMTVRYDDILPDTLVNGSDVTAEGKVVRPGYFQATKVFAKCPSKYEAAPVPKGYQPPDPYGTAGRSVPEAPRAAPRAPHPTRPDAVAPHPVPPPAPPAR